MRNVDLETNQEINLSDEEADGGDDDDSERPRKKGPSRGRQQQ
jgi:hypothetical protein